LRTWLEREARRIDKARTLLQPAVKGAGGTWADLGCGEGVFTYLLLTLLQPGSEIYTVDKNRSALQRLQDHIAESIPDASIHPLRADFTRPLSLPPLDGMVLANTLHFVRHKAPLLEQLARLLKPGGRLIVVEYNTNRGNWAVPHPIDETGFLELAQEVGLRQNQIVAKAPSTFLGEMYTGLGYCGN
jgi:ubiquinone/menaquinone biosynthesis C-methylase UbiE